MTTEEAWELSEDVRRLDAAMITYLKSVVNLLFSRLDAMTQWKNHLEEEANKRNG